MKPVPKLNEELIAKVLHHIKDEWKRYEQNVVAVSIRGLKETKKKLVLSDLDMKESEFPECGTKACFGGWALILSMTPQQVSRMFSKTSDLDTSHLHKAEKLLGLTPKEAAYLFNATDQNTPGKNYQIVVNRLREIRKLRADKIRATELFTIIDNTENEIQNLQTKLEEMEFKYESLLTDEDDLPNTEGGGYKPLRGYDAP